MNKKLFKNCHIFLVDVVGEKEPRIVYGKGRNSVSQKLFGIRAYPAIKKNLVKSIVSAKIEK